MTFGVYVHHHGAGHSRRAAALSRVMGDELVGLGSGGRPDGWCGRGWIDLPPDAPAHPGDDPTRGGSWHWVPSGHDGHRERMARLAGWVAAAGPAAVLVDVSVEVTALVELLGVPVASVVLPGRRVDAPHRLAARTATVTLLPWTPPEPPAPPAVVVGGFGRYDGRTPSGPVAPGRVVALAGTGGAGRLASVLPAARAATPGHDWHVVGGSDGEWVDDPWDLLCRAEVVVCGAGGAVVAEVAATRRPAVLVAEDRPFDEQRAGAESLVAAGAPVVVAGADDAWPDLLAAAAALDGRLWARTHDGGGARRTADALRSLAR